MTHLTPEALSTSGVASAMGKTVAALGFVHAAWIVVAVSTLVIFLTETTSNLATTATLSPVIGAVALPFVIDPAVLIVPVALSASCAFRLPVAIWVVCTSPLKQHRLRDAALQCKVSS